MSTRANQRLIVSSVTRQRLALLTTSIYTLLHVGAASGADAKASGPAVEEVIVTAQRHEERLLDTPISIGVLSGAGLDNSSSRGISDALNQVAGVSLIEVQPGNSQIAIRGVAPDIAVGTSTSGYYLDEVPFAFISTSQLPDASAFDLARVEVLRGSQGTLYGTNALSGVVRVLTNDADPDRFEAKVRARASDTSGGGENYTGDLAVNVPLVPEVLAVRGVVSYSELSGYIDSTSAGQRRINDSEAQSYRFKANYQPSENLAMKLGITRSNIKNGAPSQALPDMTTPFSADQDDERVYDTYNLIAQYNWSTVSLLSSTSYLDYRADTDTEILLSGVDVLAYFNHLGLKSLAQEFRLNSNLGGPWQWSAGAIYKDTEEETLQSAPDLAPSPYQATENSGSYAVFGDLTRSFYDGKFEVTGGVRYFADDLLSSQQSDFSGGPVASPVPADFERVTGRLVLTYKADENQMLYGSVATGFRSGLNQNFAVIPLAPELPALKPDSLMTYELGMKGSLAAGAVTYDTAVYYSIWEDIQQSLILPVGFRAYVNAGEASGLGVDASAAVQATDALMLQASVGWSGLELQEEIISSGVVLFSEGSRVNSSAEWTASVGGDYRFATPREGMDVVISSSFNYRSPVNFRFLTGEFLTETRSESLRSLRASIGVDTERWSVTVYGDNLTDDRNAVSPPDLTLANTSVRQRPRTIGVQGAFRY